MTSVSPQGRFITATFAAAPALAEPTTQHALRRYRRRAYGTLAIGIAVLLLSPLGADLIGFVERTDLVASSDLLGKVIVGGLLGLGILAAPALIAGPVSVFRAEMMSRWLARAAWSDVAVQVGHSGGTGVILLPDEESFSAVPTEPYALQTWRWRLSRLQGLERAWVARPGGRSVVLQVSGRPELYIARRSSIALLRRWYAHAFATGLPRGESW